MLCCAVASVVSDSVTPWTVTHQAPLSRGFSRQEHWSGLPRPSPGDLPNPGIKPTSLMSPALAVRFYTASATWEAPIHICIMLIVYLFQILWILIFILDVAHFLSFPGPSSKIVKRIQLKLKDWAAKRLNRQLPSKQSWNECFSICKYYPPSLKAAIYGHRQPLCLKWSHTSSSCRKQRITI